MTFNQFYSLEMKIKDERYSDFIKLLNDKRFVSFRFFSHTYSGWFENRATLILTTDDDSNKAIFVSSLRMDKGDDNIIKIVFRGYGIFYLERFLNNFFKRIGFEDMKYELDFIVNPPHTNAKQFVKNYPVEHAIKYICYDFCESFNPSILRNFSSYVEFNSIAELINCCAEVFVINHQLSINLLEVYDREGTKKQKDYLLNEMKKFFGHFIEIDKMCDLSECKKNS